MKREEVYENCLKFFNGDSLAANVVMDKYLLKDDKGEFIETSPVGFMNRYITEFIRIEKSYNESYSKSKEVLDNLSIYGQQRLLGKTTPPEKYLADLSIIPGGSILEGLGADLYQSLSNCFVNTIPDDSITSIFNSAKEMANVGKRRGGVSTDLSNLRPRGSKIQNAAKKSSGIVDWMKLYNTAGQIIGQSGRSMAMMISLDIRHPDVEEFIECKQNTNQLTNANISVKITDEFMQAVKGDDYFILRFPIDIKVSQKILDTMDPDRLYTLNVVEKGRVYIKKVKAKKIWDKIIKAAHAFAEPGVLFWDTMLDYDPTSVYPNLKAIGVNPCAEQSLSKLDSCRLIHVNLYNAVENIFMSNAKINYSTIYEMAYEAQVLGDDIVDLEIEAVGMILSKLKENPSENHEEIVLWEYVEDKARRGRRTGVGITGLADLFAAVRKSYGDFDTLQEVMAYFEQGSLDATTDMAVLRGAFPEYDRNLEYGNSEIIPGNKWYENVMGGSGNDTFGRLLKFGRRNSGLTTCAPTGSVSIFAQCSSGIEPIFKPFYIRRVVCKEEENPDFTADGVSYKNYFSLHSGFKKYLEIHGLNWETEEQLIEHFNKSPYFGQTAEELSSTIRVNTQSIIQRYISSSISSTVNLPEDVSIEEVDKIYMNAYNKKCKGITVYRNNCRAGIYVDTKQSSFNYKDAPKRPKELDAEFHYAKIDGAEIGIYVGLLEGKPYEIFVKSYPVCNKNKKGKIIKQKKNTYYFISEDCREDNLGDYSALITRWISMALRHGMHPKFIVDQVTKSDLPIYAVERIIIRVLKKYIKDMEKSANTCENCGNKSLVYKENCTICSTCGHSKCS